MSPAESSPVEIASIATAQTVSGHDSAELMALIDRFQIIAKMRLLHWQRITLGVFGALAATSFNLWHKPITPWLSQSTEVALGAGYLLMGAVLVWVRSETANRTAQQFTAKPRDQVLQAVDSVSRIGNAWLLWAAAGHILMCLATVLRARLMVAPDSLLLWLALTPTCGLLAYGLWFVPTRERLLRLIQADD